MQSREEKHQTAQSTVEFLSTPRARDLNKIVELPFVTLLGAGIQNPLGPTLTALIVEGFFPFQPGSAAPFLHIMLNPFSQETNEVAIGRVGENWGPFEELPRFFSLEFGCCPTLLFPSAFLEHDVNVGIYARFLRSFSDGPSTDGKARNLAAQLLEPERVREELSKLIFFWEGSIRNLKAQGAHEMAKTAMPLLRMFAITCRVPETGPLVVDVLALVDSQPGWR
jgi:hypothetical protein